MQTGNLLYLLLLFISFIGLSNIFKRNQIAAWKAFIPFYNFWLWYKMMNKPTWWAILMLAPGVNIIMYMVLGYHTATFFGKRKTGDLIFAILLPYLYIPMLAFNKEIKWAAPVDLDKKSGGFIKNWVDPLMFAVVAATLIRTFFFEAFTIPTSSLEKSLLVGDFLFVNKFSYGSKIPNTPLSLPFIHNTIPGTKFTPSYLDWIKIPSTRIPGYKKIKNHDIVVFNFPEGDTVCEEYPGHSYYTIIRQQAISEMNNGNPGKKIQPQKDDQLYASINQQFRYNNPQLGQIIPRPIDKREHYVKRCVAIAGDKFEIRNREIYINGKLQEAPENIQFKYIVTTSDPIFDKESLDLLDINCNEYEFSPALDPESADSNLIKQFHPNTKYVYSLNLTEEKSKRVKAMDGVLNVLPIISPKGEYDYTIFPNHHRYAWNLDNYGPLDIPKQGQTITLDSNNICIYRRIITAYEGNTLEEREGKFFINGVETKTYTIQQDYFFMMGDNRHYSLDSRYWGFVPFDHVVGTPVFIWMSLKDPAYNPHTGKSILGSLGKNSKEGKIRWERFFTFVDRDGVSSSYFLYFLAIGILAYAGNKWYQKKKAKKAND